MNKHKWKELIGVKPAPSYRCEKCGCEKFPVAFKWGGWEYVLGNYKYVVRPNCISQTIATTNTNIEP